MMDNTLQQYQPDYLISWDFNEENDAPCVCVSRVRRDGTKVTADVLGVSFEKCGCVSLRQVLERFETQQREEAERKAHAADLRKWKKRNPKSPSALTMAPDRSAERVQRPKETESKGVEKDDIRSNHQTEKTKSNDPRPRVLFY
jgi:hypothetical protein